MKQGLNNVITKKINYQFSNTNRLPIDSRYLQNFDYTVSNEVKNNDLFIGMLVFNKFDGEIYIIKEKSGKLIYEKYSNQLDIIRNISITDGNYTNLTSLLSNYTGYIVYIQELNGLFYRTGNKWINMLPYFTATNINHILTLPTEFRDNIVKVLNTTNNQFVYVNFTTNHIENSSKTINSIDEITPENRVNNRIYEDSSTTYICIDGNFIKLGEKVTTKKYIHNLTIMENGKSEVVHNLKSTYLRILLRYNLLNISNRFEVLLDKDDYTIIDENKIIIHYTAGISNLSNVEIEINT